MLVPKKASLTKRIILVSSIILIFGVIGYLIYSNFFALSERERLRRNNIDRVEVESLEVTPISDELNIDFLNKEPYTQLKQYGTLPVSAGNKGRKNPFSIVPFSLDDLR